MNKVKTLEVMYLVMKDKKLGKQLKTQFDLLPKQEQTSHKLFIMACNLFMFKQKTTYGMPEEIIKAWINGEI